MLNAQKIVDILLETGEADQDYDHESYDAIVNALANAGIPGATHREFDKYQGVYIQVPQVGRFWTKDWYPQGDITTILLVPDAGMPAVEGNDNPGEEDSITVATWSADAGGEREINTDVDELAAYCQKIINVRMTNQAVIDVVDQTLSEPKKPRKPRR